MHNQIFSSATKALYAKHLKILALDDGQLAEVDAAAEALQMQALELPELNLPQRVSSSTKRLVWGALFAAAAAVLVFLWPSKPAEEIDEYTFKGSNKVAVYYKKNSGVARLQAGEKLAADSQIRVTLTAAVNGKAYLSFFNERNEVLASLDTARKRGVTVRPGEKVSFDGSFRLTGESVGEKVVVSVCAEGSVKNFEEADLDKLQAAIKTALTDNGTALQVLGCDLVVQKLR